VADTHALAERLPRSLEASGGAASQDMLTFERWLILLKVSTRDLLGWCCFRGKQDVIWHGRRGLCCSRDGGTPSV